MTTVVVQPGATEATYQITVEINNTTYEVGATFGAGPRGPAGTIPKGEWDADTEYVADDAVVRNGSSYWATATSTNQDPDVDVDSDTGVGTYWQLMARKGANGDVTGPDSTTDGNLALWDGTDGSTLKDGGPPLALGTTSTTALAGDTTIPTVGTSEGDVPALNSDGLIDMARIASGTPDGTKFVRDDGTLATPTPTLTSLSGVLSADTSAIGITATTILTCSGLTAGTWLISTTISVRSASTTNVAAGVKAIAGTGSPVLAGVTSGEIQVGSSSSATLDAQVTLTFLAACTTASTVTIQGISATSSGFLAKASTTSTALPNASGWTAIKIA